MEVLVALLLISTLLLGFLSQQILMHQWLLRFRHHSEQQVLQSNQYEQGYALS